MRKKIQKNQPLTLKVIDFSIWNGVKFGIGFVIGTTIGSIIMAMFAGGVLVLLSMLLGIPAYV